jgi:hypothetical protein
MIPVQVQSAGGTALSGSGKYNQPSGSKGGMDSSKAAAFNFDLTKRKMTVIYDSGAMQALARGSGDIGPGYGGQGKIIDKSPANAIKTCLGNNRTGISLYIWFSKGNMWCNCAI